MQHYYGLPELVFQDHPEIKPYSGLVIAQQANDYLDITELEDNIIEGFKEVFGPEGTNPADYVYVFQ